MREEKRIIKFRAWLSGEHGSITFTEPTMDYDVTLSPQGYWCDVESGWDIHGSYKEIPIMQFTGLLDKNGVEIYEGDILSREAHHNRIVCYEKDAWVVKYLEKDKEIKEYTRKNLPRLHHFIYNCEVIGNIYQNPELLN